MFISHYCYLKFFLNRILFSVALFCLLLITACSGGGVGSGGDIQQTSISTSNLNTTLTPPDGLLDDPKAVATALSNRESVNLGVWSLLNQIGIGVYKPNGEQVLAGSEISKDDFWLYDFEVPILGKMALDSPRPFSTYHSKMASFGLTMDADQFLALYRNAYSDPANANAFLVRLYNEMGLVFEGNPNISPLQQFLLTLDAFYDPSTNANRTAFVGRQLANKVGQSQQPVVGLGNPVVNICNDINLVIKNPLYKFIDGVKNLEILDPRDLLSAFLLYGSVSTNLALGSDATHQVHPYESPKNIRVAARVLVDFQWPDELIACGSLAGVDFPEGGPMKDIVVNWSWDTDLVTKHGWWNWWDGHIAMAAPRTKTDSEGFSYIEFEPKKEDPKADRNKPEDVDAIRVTASYDVQSSQVPGSPTLSTMISAIIMGFLAGDEDTVYFGVYYHKRGDGKKITIDVSTPPDILTYKWKYEIYTCSYPLGPWKGKWREEWTGSAPVGAGGEGCQSSGTQTWVYDVFKEDIPEFYLTDYTAAGVAKGGVNFLIPETLMVFTGNFEMYMTQTINMTLELTKGDDSSATLDFTGSRATWRATCPGVSHSGTFPKFENSKPGTLPMENYDCSSN